MNREDIVIGIAYNDFDPVTVTKQDRVSDESVEQMAEEVLATLVEAGYSAAVIPLSRSLMTFLKRIRELKVDVLINFCEGFLGRPQLEANVAGVFELLGITFTGNNSRALALCQDKFKAKAILHAFGLPTAKGMLVASPEMPVEMKFPLIVKPNFEDASLGVFPDSVVHDQKSLSERIQNILERYKQPALVEEYIDGREFNVAIMDGERPEALPVSEIDFSGLSGDTPRIISYEAKWFEDHLLYIKTPPVCPARIDDALRTGLQQLAAAAFQAMGCRDYVRVDFRMGRDGRIVILEVNPNPDISLNAGYVRGLQAAGVSYLEFWERMIERALARKEQPWSCTDFGWDMWGSGEEEEAFWRRLLENALRRRERRWYGL